MEFFKFYKCIDIGFYYILSSDLLWFLSEL